MALLVLVEFAFMAILLYGGITQVIVPLWRGTSLFPMFSTLGKGRRYLKHKLTEAMEGVDNAELEQEIKNKKKQARNIRKQRS